MSDETTELQGILDEFEHECYMLRVEASETRARYDVVRKSYERIRDEFARRIAATLGGGKLTAEQVRKAVDGHGNIMDNRLYEDWQAVADELNATLRSGTLTAEQVKQMHEIIEKHWHDLPAEYDMPEATALSEYSFDWQAIADELNATMGGGECEQVLVDCDDGLMPPFTAHCSKCGKQWGSTPKFCPECGARVVRTRDERKAVKR